MNSIINKPHLAFCFSIPITLLFGILNTNETLNLNVHDTYFVFSKYDLSILISVIFGLLSFGYWVMKKANRKLVTWLSFIHILITIGGFIFLFCISLFFKKQESELPDYETRNLIVTLTMLVILFGQLFYFLNIIIGIFRKK